MLFSELGLENSVIRAIEEMNFVEPMPVQAKVIPHLIENDPKDIIALAQTGTGKTAAFGLPLIHKSNGKPKKIKHIILSPTRELCLQIADDLRDFSKYKDEVKITAVFGGSSIDKQITTLRKGVHIVSATPGRLLDLINRNKIDISRVETVVLDEADEMLNMGFRDELDAIINETPSTRNTLLFSATMPKEVLAISKRYLTDPIEITIGKRNAGAPNIEHECFFVHARDRYLALKRIVDFHPDIYGLVFCRTRRETQEITDKLIKDGYNADSLHGDLSQAQRSMVMSKFKIKHLKLLIATDVAARGLDVHDLTHVINYNLPDDLEIYTHRSGRTGRAGKSGTSIVIANLKEKNKLGMIEKQLGKKFKHMTVPLGKEVCEKQLFYLIDRMEKVEVDHSQIDAFLPEIIKKLEWLDREELIKKFVSVEFNRFVEYYKNTADLNKPDKKRSDKKGGTEEGFTRFFLNLGKTDNIKPASIIGMINDFSGVKDIEIGAIDILQNFSFFETDSKYDEDLLKAFNGQKLDKRKIVLEVASAKTDDRKESGKSKSFRKSRSPRKGKDSSRSGRASFSDKRPKRRRRS